jgi:hypothetical protein
MKVRVIIQRAILRANQDSAFAHNVRDLPFISPSSLITGCRDPLCKPSAPVRPR